MTTAKKHTWTVSVIAMVDRGEAINERLVQWDAYNEFEDSITSINRANKDIQFVIYLYDVKDKRAYIKKSTVVKDRYEFDIVEFRDLPNFYLKGYPHLVAFFKDHVAKKELEEGEEHKQFLLMWGHAAGLGFLKQKIEKNIESKSVKNKAYERASEEIRKTIKKNAHTIANEIYCYNYFCSQLSIKPKGDPRNIYTEKIFPATRNGRASLEIALDNGDSENFDVITANELAGILAEGFREDRSVCTEQTGAGQVPLPGRKVQVMLCLSCYVNMIETGYALRKIVNVYIAPSTQISHYGYNYYKLFKLLCRHPESTEREISRNITDYYLVKYLKKPVNRFVSDYSIFGIDYKHGVSFSAVYLHKYDGDSGVIQKIKNFTTQIEPFIRNIINDKAVRTVLQEARIKCLSTSNGGLDEIGIIDYQNFLSRVFGSLGLLLNFNESSFFSSDHVIARYYPGTLADSTYNSVLDLFTSQSPGSFSIFFPHHNSPIERALIKIYLLQRKKNEFLANTQWDHIIKLVK